MISGIYSPTPLSNGALEPKKATWPGKLLVYVLKNISSELSPHKILQKYFKKKIKECDIYYLNNQQEYEEMLF